MHPGPVVLGGSATAKVRSMDLIVVATAMSVIAISIMPDGHTAHSQFKIPIKISGNTMCSFTK